MRKEYRHIIWNDTDGATDQKFWDFMSNGASLLLRAVNDTYSASNTIMQVVRSGYTVSSISFDAGTLYVDAVNNRVGLGTSSLAINDMTNVPALLALSMLELTWRLATICMLPVALQVRVPQAQSWHQSGGGFLV